MVASKPILLIDNDQAWLETLSEYLQDRGFGGPTAQAPSEGIEVLDSDDIRGAVVDFEMPEMNGLELLREIRRRDKALVVLLLSSEEDPSIPEQARAEGAQGFL